MLVEISALKGGILLKGICAVNEAQMYYSSESIESREESTIVRCNDLVSRCISTPQPGSSKVASKVGVMKSRFSNKERQLILEEGRLRGGVKEVCREYGISASTYYRWKSEFDSNAPHLKDHIRSLELENRQLKHKVAELSLDYSILRSALVNERSSEC